MKRTTIMVEEDLLHDLKQLAQQQQRSTSSVIREALATYVVEQRQRVPLENPLLELVALGESAEPMNLANGGDEELLHQGAQAPEGWKI